jgi:alkanesulfonate monooxygenase SsuD/methylene tetrahydromethanopterin reductase-like flavin-dependent oxidoreductase (luciferase family)
MEIGLFCPTFHPPHREPAAAQEWDLQVLRWADSLGFAEAWIGEHFTLGWEPLPEPDLLIAAALRETERIRLGPAAHLLPYHHPANLAARIAHLDRVSGGRYMVAFGAGSYRTDQELFATEGAAENGAMTAESMRIILGLWDAWSRGEAFNHEGDYWSVNSPAFSDSIHGPHLRPHSGTRPNVAIVGASPRSSSLRRAGADGFIPMTVVHSRDYAAGHWEVYAEGAAEAGRVADRAVWRLSHPLFVADTDAEARAHSLGGAMGDTYREWILPYALAQGTLPHFAPGVDPGGITPEVLADRGWFIGDPDTVAAGIASLYEETGGFGTLLATVYDYAEEPGLYQRSLQLLAEEVVPRVERLVGTDPIAAAV